MKFITLILLNISTAVCYTQSVYSIIETPNTVDTSLHITGIANVAISIATESIDSFAGIGNLSTGISIETGLIGLVANTSNFNSFGVAGLSDNGIGIYGRSKSETGAGVQGENRNGHGIEGITGTNDPMFAGIRGDGGQSSLGVLGTSGSGIGVRGFSPNGVGIFAKSESGDALEALSTSGTGLFAKSTIDVAGRFTSIDPSQPDIELPTSVRNTGGTISFHSEGIISSDVSNSVSSLRLWTNQNLTIELDRDGGASDNGFIIRDSDDDRILSIRETTGAELKGPLEIFAQTGDNGIIRSDRTSPSSDLIIDSNDDIVLQLDNNGGDSGELRVEDQSDNLIFRLTESGNLSIAGTLNQGSDINRKHSITLSNNKEVLSKISALPLYDWKYNGEDTPHLGPMAQDFYAAFQLGQGETTISSVDADGVALAGIKALIDENQQLKKEIAEIKQLLSQILKTEH